MHPIRNEFSREIFNKIDTICVSILSDISNKNKRIEDVLGIESQDLEIIINKIINSLPEYIFSEKTPNVKLEVLEYVTKEYIMFQSQEDISNKNYIDHLSNFIYEIINTINTNYRGDDF